MPRYIDPQTINADSLPGIWSPVQWEMDEVEHAMELENQATASLLWTVDLPEALLRLAINETDIENIHKPPKGYDPDLQGLWEEDIITFKFKREVELIRTEREADHLYLEYRVEDLGTWAVEFKSSNVNIYHI